jgi:hypothetical protein
MMVAWTPFERMDTLIDGAGNHLPVPSDSLILKNSRYQVWVRRVWVQEFQVDVIWLSIKRLDREAIHDWRDLQRIKNEICGPECEGIELYPAESRLVDTSNQYHLYVFAPGVRVPLGFQERLVMEGKTSDPMASKAEQRPWDDDTRPKDLVDPDEAVARYKKMIGRNP